MPRAGACAETRPFRVAESSRAAQNARDFSRNEAVWAHAATFARCNCLTTCRRRTVANGLLKELQEVEPVALPERDVRAGKPLLGNLLKFDLARGAVRDRDARRARPARPAAGDLHGTCRQERRAQPGRDPPHVGPGARLPPARRPRDGAAVRALGPVPRARSAPRAPARDRLALPDHAGRAPVRPARGQGVPVVLRLLRVTGLRAHLRLGVPLGVRAAQRAHLAGCRLPPPRRARWLGREHQRRLARTPRQPRDRALRLRRAHARRCPGRPPRLPFAGTARASLRRDRRGADRRRRLPRGGGRRAGGPLPSAGRARPGRALHHGDPHGARGVRARPGAPAVRAEASGVRGRGLRAQAHLRPRRRPCCSCSSSRP